MIILGIHDSHNPSAAIVKDGKILCAIEEERLSRKKTDFGFPKYSIIKCLELSGLHFHDIDLIAVSGITDPLPLIRKRFHGFETSMTPLWHIQYTVWKHIYRLKEQLIYKSKLSERLIYLCNKSIINRKIRDLFSLKPPSIVLIDHHICHASSGYFISGLREALVVCLDGSGDGKSCVIYAARDNTLKPLVL